MKTGDWYGADNVEASINALTTAAQNAGYAFAEVRPRLTRNAETHTIDLVFEVVEGPRVFVERIDIVGNVRTKDQVIRREFRLAEGDAFSAARIARSRQRIVGEDFPGADELSQVVGGECALEEPAPLVGPLLR